MMLKDIINKIYKKGSSIMRCTRRKIRDFQKSHDSAFCILLGIGEALLFFTLSMICIGTSLNLNFKSVATTLFTVSFILILWVGISIFVEHIYNKDKYLCDKAKKYKDTDIDKAEILVIKANMLYQEAEYFNLLGNIYMAKRYNNSSCIKVYTAAIDLVEKGKSKSNCIYWRNRAAAYIRAGDSDNAICDLNRYAAKNDNFTLAQLLIFYEYMIEAYEIKAQKDDSEDINTKLKELRTTFNNIRDTAYN